MSFSDTFTWGASTAAYQIEGAADAAGKGQSVWDQMAHWPGKVYQGHTGDRACDHYHHLEEDLDLMASIGLQGYRFSFSWPRVLPGGVGTVNEAGLSFYDRLIDGLLERGIEPWATLFHWDYPMELYYRGGWLNADCSDWFAEYAQVIADRFGDRIGNWITINEPQIFVGFGYWNGVHAPGLQLSPADLARITHHVLKAHGKAVSVLRASCQKAPHIGWAPAVGSHTVDRAFEGDSELVAQAREGQFTYEDKPEAILGSALWCEPVFKGEYPEKFLSTRGQYLPQGWEADIPSISASLDFCGLNIYSAAARYCRDEAGAVDVRGQDALGLGMPRTMFHWGVVPESLYWGPRFFHERYGLPIVITENGMSSHDWVGLDGAVHDLQRIDFTTRYLRELRRAAADGTRVDGYFHWSLLDNFEWAEGYLQRFGLIHVDFETTKRTPKDSALWYGEVIRANGSEL